MTAAEIVSATSNGVNAIRINRPAKKNALTRDMYAALAMALRTGEADMNVGCHLMLGQPGAFSAGNDMADFATMADEGAGPQEAMGFIGTLATLSKPLVVGVDGLAIGIGTTMLLHADVVFASDRSQFRTPFVDLGLTPEAASSLLAPRLMGHVRAFELLCLGVAFDATTAQSVGLVNRVVPVDALEATAAQCAAVVAARPREAMRQSRELLRRGTVGPAEVLKRINEESNIFRARLASDEARAAVQAFLTRRQ